MNYLGKIRFITFQSCLLGRGTQALIMQSLSNHAPDEKSRRPNWSSSKPKLPSRKLLGEKMFSRGPNNKRAPADAEEDATPSVTRRKMTEPSSSSAIASSPLNKLRPWEAIGSEDRFFLRFLRLPPPTKMV